MFSCISHSINKEDFEYQRKLKNTSVFYEKNMIFLMLYGH